LHYDREAVHVSLLCTFKEDSPKELAKRTDLKQSELFNYF
jgi:hypothetical protein